MNATPVPPKRSHSSSSLFVPCAFKSSSFLPVSATFSSISTCHISSTRRTAPTPPHLSLSSTTDHNDQQQYQQQLNSSQSQSQSPNTFADLYPQAIPPWLSSRLSALGFENPTPIQRQVLPLALPPTSSRPGRDVVIHAQTGSGKTLAYLIPTISVVSPPRSSIQALVVVPTQELGMQVYKLLRRLTSAYATDHHPHHVHLIPDDNQHNRIRLGEGEAGEETFANDYNEKEEKVEEEEEDDDDDYMFDDDDDDDDEIDIDEKKGSFPVLPMLNQANLRRQKLQLRQAAPRIIVGNPHRVAELVRSGRLRLDLLRLLVVDEFDACLADTATTAALHTILSVRNVERDRQTILASATVPQHRHFLRQCVRQRWTRPDIRHVWLDEDSGVRVPPSLSHYYAMCDSRRKKLAALLTLIARLRPQYAIVFVMPGRDVASIVNALNEPLRPVFARHEREEQVDRSTSTSVNAANKNSDSNEDQDRKNIAPVVVGIHNDLPVTLRKIAVNSFKNGEARVLVGTDVAARGLDFTHVSHVFHFDLPSGSDAYLHRAGRAARLGRAGSSVVMITPGEEFVVTRMANTLGIEFDRVAK